ncbi:hypothetical protein EV147_3882 [Cupriavidus agavae]|uniref:Uncharacterized protein n=1 Tax=Cupriavidus agavae TaxID=1001822 RepID=A0A4Q7RP68_9BURK|nr:hypothetical protein EV147_3882 [Cupriavidus agavae]
MMQKPIEARDCALPHGRYWAIPHEPFPLDGPNGHDEVYPGAECISDGLWVSFVRNSEEVWACNATYAAAHFDCLQIANAPSSPSNA